MNDTCKITEVSRKRIRVHSMGYIWYLREPVNIGIFDFSFTLSDIIKKKIVVW